MDAINKNTPTKKSGGESLSLPPPRAQIQNEMRRNRKLSRRQKKNTYRQAASHKLTRYTDHYCNECQHDVSGLLDHYCPCSHDDARRMHDHFCACQHQLEKNDDHWCPCPHTLSRSFIDEKLLNEIDTEARNRLEGASLKPAFIGVSCEGGLSPNV